MSSRIRNLLVLLALALQADAATPGPATPAPLLEGNLLKNGNFESGVAGWNGMGNALILATKGNEPVHSGKGGLACIGREYSAQVPRQDILAALLAQGEGLYDFEAWVRLAEGSASCRIVVRLTYGGTDYYVAGAKGLVSSNQWTKVASDSGIYVSWAETLTAAVLYVEPMGTLGDFYVDDVVMRKADSETKH